MDAEPQTFGSSVSRRLSMELLVQQGFIEVIRGLSVGAAIHSTGHSCSPFVCDCPACGCAVTCPACPTVHCGHNQHL
eukprot:7626156-Pyramimonas_sp.AAC.1